VAGLITTVRPYMTKSNKPMGFVTLEDIQGNIELVLFPRTWEKNREQLTVGRIIIVEGKVDTNSTPPKILVDTIRTEIKILESLDESPAIIDTPLAKPTPAPAVLAPQQPTQNMPLQKKMPVKPGFPLPSRQIAEQAAPAYMVDADFDNMPPPPDNFPADWDNEWQPHLTTRRSPRARNQKLTTDPSVSRVRWKLRL